MAIHTIEVELECSDPKALYEHALSLGCDRKVLVDENEEIDVAECMMSILEAAAEAMPSCKNIRIGWQSGKVK